MIEVRQTDVFRTWLASLRDVVGKAVIARRLSRIESGNLGDAKSVGSGVSELRIDFGPGYRVYYTKRGKTVVLLLIGGDKDSQTRDIAKAKALAAQLGEP
jgi:putative addiction module killer protein